MALRLGRLCGNGPMLRLRMQVAHDLWRARQRLPINSIEAHPSRPVYGGCVKIDCHA